MTRDDFLVEMLDVLQRDEPLYFSSALSELDEWDSLAIMATMAFLEKNFGVQTSFADFKMMTTVEDIAKKAGI